MYTTPSGINKVTFHWLNHSNPKTPVVVFDNDVVTLNYLAHIDFKVPFRTDCSLEESISGEVPMYLYSKNDQSLDLEYMKLEAFMYLRTHRTFILTMTYGETDMRGFVYVQMTKWTRFNQAYRAAVKRIRELVGDGFERLDILCDLPIGYNLEEANEISTFVREQYENLKELVKSSDIEQDVPINEEDKASSMSWDDYLTMDIGSDIKVEEPTVLPVEKPLHDMFGNVVDKSNFLGAKEMGRARLESLLGHISTYEGINHVLTVSINPKRYFGLLNVTLTSNLSGTADFQIVDILVRIDFYTDEEVSKTDGLVKCEGYRIHETFNFSDLNFIGEEVSSIEVAIREVLDRYIIVSDNDVNALKEQTAYVKNIHDMLTYWNSQTEIAVRNLRDILEKYKQFK